MGKTKIEWTEYSWNPVSGCTPASEGCQNCYARRMANRLRGRCGYPQDDPFRVTLHEDRLGEPLRWKQPRRVFVCSMGDLFHEDVPDEFIARIWWVIGQCAGYLDPSRYRGHTFIILTKRPERMQKWLNGWNDRETRRQWIESFGEVYDWMSGPKYWPDVLPNVWLGVTAENQQRADERIPILLQIPAAVRFISVEPMLGPVDVSYYLSCCGSCNAPINKKDPSWRWNGICWEHKCPSNHPQLGYFAAYTGVDWVICGGETGPGARPMHPDWVRSLRDQCQAAEVPFFFKQHGEWVHETQGIDFHEGHKYYVWPDESMSFRVGKKAASRILDGRTWDEMPEI